MNTRQLLIAAALTCATAAPAFAYNTGSCYGQKAKWGTNTPQMRISATSFPNGYWRDGMTKTLNYVNQNPSNFMFTSVTDTGGVSLSNSENEVWGSSDQNILQGAPAITYWNDTCLNFLGIIFSYRNEADVIFDYGSPFQWTANETKSSLIYYGGSLRQLQGTGIHEFGHAAGLLHVNTEYNIMGADFLHIWANGSTAKGYLGEDASDGLAYLYGLRSSNYQDLSVAHWKYAYASGQYSWHARTGVFTSTGGALPTIAVGGETGYRVSRGSTVQVEFTYENNGKSTQTSTVGWYVSTNDTISTGDRLLASSSMTLSRDNVYTFRRNVVIPSDLVSGRTYWLGTVIDTGNAVPDANRSNNATYIPIYVN